LGGYSPACKFCVLVMAFELDPRLQADTLHLASLPMCELLLMNDCRYPWAILVPHVVGARELHDLSDDQQIAIHADMMRVSRAIGAWPGVEKVNIGALGNVVAQLHIHIVGRHAGDPAWPGPVWGHSPRVPYGRDLTDPLMDYLRALKP
jgi:diadenosine tetraphosphate (Ap4A) HIT family hydrolase